MRGDHELGRAFFLEHFTKHCGPTPFLEIRNRFFGLKFKKDDRFEVSHDASRRGLFRALARSNSTSTGGWWQRGMHHGQPGRCADCSRTGLVASPQEKMEDANNESVAGGATSACEAQPADRRSKPTEDTLRNMQAAAPRYDAGGQLGSGCCSSMDVECKQSHCGG